MRDELHHIDHIDSIDHTLTRLTLLTLLTPNWPYELDPDTIFTAEAARATPLSRGADAPPSAADIHMWHCYDGAAHANSDAAQEGSLWTGLGRPGKPGLLEHEVSKPLQGMNFFVDWRCPPCVGKPGLLEHEVSKHRIVLS